MSLLRNVIKILEKKNMGKKSLQKKKQIKED